MPPSQPSHAGPPGNIRDTLFGDLPLSEWSQDKPEAEPWTWFAEARAARDRGDEAGAVHALERVLGARGLEARHYLQAFQGLRELGFAAPDEVAKNVLGVVVEVAMDDGLDLLAAYADRSARYYNYSGAGVVWDRPDDSLDEPIAAVLDAGSTIVAQIGPWDGDRPEPPPNGHVRLNMLTPSGLHFGQAPFEAFARDGLAGPLLQAATQLMQRLVTLSGR
ncbi:MAG: hypothetical protein U0610_08490 [bacterium]